MKKITRAVIALLLLSTLMLTLSPLACAADDDVRFEYDITVDELTDLGLSVIEINTDSGDYVRSRIEYVGASMSITLSDEYASCTNAYTEGALPIEIKGRGNSTWNNGYADGKPNTLGGDTHTRKVPYNIKLSEKADLFGMGERKSWVLIANYMDRSNLRNKLIYDLSANMGMYYTKSVYVNLMLNGEYMGVYMLCEKIDEELFDGKVTDWNDIAEAFANGIASDRSLDDAAKDELEEYLKTDLSWITTGYVRFDGERERYRLSDYVDSSEFSIYSGYLFEYDGYADEESFFQTEHGVPLKVKNMEYIKTNGEIFGYVQNYFSEFEEALYSDTFYNSKGKHYSEYIDVDSFVDYYILNAIILNVEFGYKSMFMYMNDEGRLVLGPCWDYDWSSGNPFLGANGDYNAWYNDWRASNNHWYHQLYGDPWFVTLVRERWMTLSGGIEDMISSMDDYYDYLQPTIEIEYDKFSADPYERDFPWRTGGRSFLDEYMQLRTFLQKRYQWMDQQLYERDPDIEGLGWNEDDSIRLTVDVAKGQINERGEMGVGDLVATEFSAFTVMLSVPDAGDYTFYLNGIEYETLSVGRQHKEVGIEFYEEQLCNGVNVITVLKNVKGMSAESMAFISVQMPGEKYQTVTVGRLGPNLGPATDRPEQNKPEDDGNDNVTVAPPESEPSTGTMIPLPLILGIAFDLLSFAAITAIATCTVLLASPIVLVLVVIIVILLIVILSIARRKKRGAAKDDQEIIQQSNITQSNGGDYDQSNGME